MCIFLLQKYVEEKKFDGDWSSFLLIFVGAGNTCGRIVLGYFSDKPQVNRLFVYNTCLTICGIGKIIVRIPNDLIFLSYWFIYRLKIHFSLYFECICKRSNRK